MPPSADPSTINTPLPPSVEKAYYRKCIELKRRLNDVEAANDEAKVRRERLDRGILKMRLERAILLDDLRRKMEGREGDAGSEGSAEYAGAMSPAERTIQWDSKRRKSVPSAPPAPSTGSHAHQSATSIPPPGPAAIPIGSREQDSRYGYDGTPAISAPSASTPAYASTQPAQVSPSPYGRDDAQRRHVNGNTYEGDRERDSAPTNRAAGVTGEALSAGPSIGEDINGERRVVSSADGGNGESRARSSSGHR